MVPQFQVVTASSYHAALPFETHQINSHAQKPNSELFNISQGPKTPQSSFRATKCNFIVLLSEGRTAEGSESSNKVTPPPAYP